MRIDQDNVINIWLLEAKKLQQTTKSETLSHALPVLRRLLATKVLVDISLPDLHKSREMVQRKHLLQMLALENGHASWAEFKLAIVEGALGDKLLLPYSIELKNAGYPVLWFATLQQAEDYSLRYAGRVVAVGTQAVWLPK